MKHQAFYLTIVAMVAVAILEGVALARGINGASFGIAIAVIAGLAGYKIKPPSK